MQYQWLAIYNDNTALPQYPKEGVENKYVNIRRDKLEKFVVLTREANPRVILVAHVPSGGRLIYRQRVEKRIGSPDVRVWIVGCQTTIDGKNNQYISAIFEDGHIETVDRWAEDSRWFRSPHIRPEENEDWEGIIPSYKS